MERLDNPVQAYAWGSRTAIASMQGRSPSTEPEAELWLGAHPSAPSLAGGQRLDELIAADPVGCLGGAVARQYGALPFLLKVLAAEQPLSLQAHPSLAQARAGFAREEAQGLARTAPNRNYRDANHKPELLCALTPFDALCGFRRLDETLALFDGLKVRSLGVHVEALARDGLAPFFERVMTLGGDERRSVAADVVAACRTHPPVMFLRECEWAVRLGSHYPGDVGVVGALLLNLVRLGPGQALYLGAGNLHAYLRGTGIEVMASSDNVLRGGLTPKHVDVPELMRVLEFKDGPVEVLEPDGWPEALWESDAADFRLSRLVVDETVTLPRSGPDILLCTGGAVEVRVKDQTLQLKGGQSAFLRADDGVATLSGQGVLFRATVGALTPPERPATPSTP